MLKNVKIRAFFVQPLKGVDYENLVFAFNRRCDVVCLRRRG